MKNYSYIIILALITILAGCAGTGELAEAKQAERDLLQKQVEQALDSKNFVIKANKLYSRQFRRMELKPEKNYILVKDNMARINMAYVGRSFYHRPISAINLSGEVEELSITPKRKGSKLIRMRVRGSGEIFEITIHLSAYGDCAININNARLEHISYNGKLSARL